MIVPLGLLVIQSGVVAFGSQERAEGEPPGSHQDDCENASGDIGRARKQGVRHIQQRLRPNQILFLQGVFVGQALPLSIEVVVQAERLKLFSRRREHQRLKILDASPQFRIVLRELEFQLLPQRH